MTIKIPDISITQATPAKPAGDNSCAMGMDSTTPSTLFNKAPDGHLTPSGITPMLVGPKSSPALINLEPPSNGDITSVLVSNSTINPTASVQPCDPSLPTSQPGPDGAASGSKLAMVAKDKPKTGAVLKDSGHQTAQ